MTVTGQWAHSLPSSFTDSWWQQRKSGGSLVFQKIISFLTRKGPSYSLSLSFSFQVYLTPWSLSWRNHNWHPLFHPSPPPTFLILILTPASSTQILHPCDGSLESLLPQPTTLCSMPSYCQLRPLFLQVACTGVLCNHTHFLLISLK